MTTTTQSAKPASAEVVDEFVPDNRFEQAKRLVKPVKINYDSTVHSPFFWLIAGAVLGGAAVWYLQKQAGKPARPF